jgi:ATP-binding cassette, subfamily B, bacterial PglK
MNGSAVQKKLRVLLYTFKFSFSFLSKSDQRKYLMAISLSILLNFMDIVGIFLLGLFGTLAIRGIQSRPQGDTVSTVLELIGLSQFSFQVQAFTLSSVAVLVLTSKSYCSLVLNRKIFNFLASRSAVISTKVFKDAYSRNLQFINSISFQEIRHSTNFAIYSLVSVILGAGAVLAADLTLLLFLSVAIGIFDALSLFLILTLFSISAVFLLQKQFSKAKSIGQESTEFSIASDVLLYDGINLYREYYVRDMRSEVINRLQALKLSQARIIGEQAFLPSVGKYIIESTILFGVIVVSGLQFILHDANHAVAGVAIFISSAGRIAPALMRMQQNLTQISNSMGETQRVRNLIQALGKDVSVLQDNDVVSRLDTSSSEIEINNLNFQFAEKSAFKLRIEKLTIKPNSSVAIIGPSGAGKTSLVDIILGVLPSVSGSVTIGGLSPLRAICINPNLISYVPQRVQLINGSIYENIVLLKEGNSKTRDRVDEVLKMSDLHKWVNSLPYGMDTKLGPLGITPSGGQTQRLGIARALYVDPKIIVMDEATSALDFESENRIKETIARAKGKATVITVAHRISTVKDSEIILIMKDGEIVESGSFQELSTNGKYLNQMLNDLI